MPRVYVVQEQPKYDIAVARKFGEIVVILPPSSHSSSFSYDYLVTTIFEKLQEIEPGDFLLLIGDPVCIGLVTAAASQLLGTRVPINFLKWLPRENDYLPVSVSLA